MNGKLLAAEGGGWVERVCKCLEASQQRRTLDELNVSGIMLRLLGGDVYNLDLPVKLTRHPFLGLLLQELELHLPQFLSFSLLHS